jgi:MoxR-like ATPase
LTDTNRVAEVYQRILDEISRVVIGKDVIKSALMVALVADGHLLIEGMEGSGKTKLARSFAESIGGVFKRIQFTPDIMPADITAFNLYTREGEARFIEGPVFANVVLADELNRTTPRTQSAMLESMQESQVTVEGSTYPLPKPFTVIATQVHAGGEGTYALTDEQADRFLLHVTSEYLSKEQEKQIVSHIDEIDVPQIKAVTTPEEIIQMQELAKQVHVSEPVLDYLVSIIDFLRAESDTLAGPSSRGSVALYKCSRVTALLDGRDYVIPDDVRAMVRPTLAHRVRMTPEAEIDDIIPDMVLDRALEQVPLPKPEV